MLDLRPAIVLDSDGSAAEQRLGIALLETLDGDLPDDGGLPADAGAVLRGQRREAICDTALLGRAEPGDRVIVNTAAVELGLGSGGFDVVHVNLTRGLREGGQPQPPGPPDAPPAGELRARRVADREHVMKLNYTSLQHAVDPVEDRRPHGRGSGSPQPTDLRVPLGRPVAVLALHGQLAAVAWAFAQVAGAAGGAHGGSGARLGYIQTGGGALPGGHSRTVAALRERGLLAGHITAGPAFGGEHEAITTAGAVHHGLAELGWDAAVCGPGPGMVGSGSALGHGGMVALDSAHVALALGCPTLLVARLSGADARARHRPISHHTLTVLDLLLEPVCVALPAGVRSPVGAELRAGLADVFAAESPEPPAVGPDMRRPVRITRHDWRRAAVDLPGFAASGLAAPTMGRGPLQDPLFFAAALAGGAALAELLAASRAERAEAGAGDVERV